MATQNLSPALRAPASSRPYPKTTPGYGKRSAPDQRPRRDDDFMLLPERERSIAGYIDHLPDGAAMDIKSLAKSLPLYGQMAVATALKALAVAGYLRHVRCRGGEGDQVRWVTLTFWSRTARDNAWWGSFLAAENDRAGAPAAAPTTAPPPPRSGAQAPAPPVSTPAPTAPPRPPAVPAQPDPGSPSPAYLALARLGRVDARLALSATDCEVLEDLARQWLDRGVSTDYLTQALSSGLPTQVDSPVGFVRRRLWDKLPPVLPDTPAASAGPVRHLMMECTECGTPGRPEALPDGLCRPCRAPGGAVAPNHAAAPTAPAIERDISVQVGQLRDLLKAP